MSSADQDDSPLWSQNEYGDYCLLFPNKHALSLDEIREIFNAFGKVKFVSQAGDERGFRFIFYATQEEAQCAVEGVQDDPRIKLLPYRPKNRKQNTANAVNNNTDNYQRNFFQRKPPRNQDGNVNSDSELNENFNCKLKADNSSVSSKGSNCSAKMNPLNNHIISPKRNSRDIDLPSLATNPSTLKLFSQLNASNNLPTKESNSNNNQLTNNDADDIPDLVTKTTKLLTKKSKTIILNAEEIVVANIHNDYGSAYILHLFDSFEPLAVSYVKTLPKSQIRYCHVYFKNIEDSLEVETQFDNYDLAGKKLVVMRPCTLIEEAEL